ncbi:CDP-alcohol phosphatidyltransferase family protein [Pantoea ananatis]|uniref:CDP-alcohol phosphatidyltransferase family protein n=1 Tax=Pantoea ananas TaxID=553 RepID=UPI002220A81B|nr:CDP-alcohol phosphatidyltransferase family protein [Pantoea ananatis]
MVQGRGAVLGFYAIIAAANGQFVHASVAVFVAAVMDGLDGRVARLTGTSSEFGVQYDSLADLVSFGMAPALVMYHWSLSALKFDGSIACGWTTCTGATSGHLEQPATTWSQG